jgi:hypothetical protein
VNETFEGKLRAAAGAGWWTLLIGVVFFIFQWIAYLWIVSARPAWPLILWGNGVTWDTVQNIWFWGAAIFKFCLCILALIVVWLTLWERQLRKQAGGA